MPEDPIERLNVDIEVFGIPQTPGMPPMTEAFLHIRRRQDGSAERAVLGLPAYQGEPGERGPAGMVHQGTRTRPQLEGLALTLGENELNFTYRCAGTDDLWVWTGSTFITFPNAFGTKGDRGLAPVMQGGTVTIDGEQLDTPAGVRIDGADGGPYTVGIDLPELPKGPKGDRGLSGPIYDSVDVDQTTPPADKQILVHDAASGKLKWRDAPLPSEEYSVSSTQFPNVTKQPADTRHKLVSIQIPAMPYWYRPVFSGGVDIKRVSGHQIDVQVVADDENSEAIYAYGRGSGSDAGGWDRVRVAPYFPYPISPDSRDDLVPPGNAVTFHMVAVKKASVLPMAWQIRRDFAELRIRLERVPYSG